MTSDGDYRRLTALTPTIASEFPIEGRAVWKRVSVYGDGYVPRSLLEQQIVQHSCHYEWSGGEPDPRQLPEGYRQLPHDNARAQRSLQSEDKLVRAVIWLPALCVAVLVAGSV